MAKVNENIIFIWSGTNASIPTGYSRETALDGKFPKGEVYDDDPGNTGGLATHTHTSPAHSHTLGSHTHSVSLAASTAGGNSTGSTSSGGPSSNHGHVAATSGAQQNGVLSSETASYASTNSEPPYKEVIFIKSDGTQGIPDDVIALFDKTTLPTGWQICDGNNNTPDYNNKFLKGAAASGDAGGTGGATTHTHTISHTHTETGHTHARFNSGGYSATTDFETASGTADSVQSHNHWIDLLINTVGVSGTPTSGTGSNLPSYKRLLAIQNQNGADDLPRDVIGLWIGTVASIPNGWKRVAGMSELHLYVTSDTGAINDTGGSNTHTHSDSHSHTGGSHTHTADVEVQAATNNLLNSGHSLPKPHGHTASVGSSSANWQSSNTTGDSSNQEPAYYTVIFVQRETYMEVSDSVSVGESNSQTQVYTVSVSDSVSAEEDRIDATVRDGNDRNISIWKENVAVTDVPSFPGPRDGFITEEVGVGESVTVKIITPEDDNFKPSFKVEI